ncbi:aminotransferase class I/II-fold pyridoxal phosphate-dependent enzyme [Shewanella intestini]|nr:MULTISPECIES: 8-amino-7-oxononanoate synthase [Shewanella]
MQTQLVAQKKQHQLRQRKLSPQSMVDFSHNDYLGLASEPLLADALYQGARQYGVGSKASPLVSGYSSAHQALEQQLCQVTGHQACMLFSSGFSANCALMNTLLTPNDVALTDKLIHASIIDGIQHSGAKLSRFLHNDLTSLQTRLQQYPNSIVVTESIFSMDGDGAPLMAMAKLCQQYQAWLVVDDAHGFGVTGDISTQLSATNAAIADIQVVTFGKALGCQGAAVLASNEVIEFLVANARDYIYSTALSPASAHLALSALKLLNNEPQRRRRLATNIRFFKAAAAKHGITLIHSNSAIQPVIIGDNQTTMLIAKQLAEQGFAVGAIRSPTVPKGAARLRVTLNSQHTEKQIEQLLEAISVEINSAGHA